MIDFGTMTGFTTARNFEISVSTTPVADLSDNRDFAGRATREEDVASTNLYVGDTASSELEVPTNGKGSPQNDGRGRGGMSGKFDETVTVHSDIHPTEEATSSHHLALETKKTGITRTTVLVVKSFLGGAFLFLPHAVMKGGVVLSLCTLAVAFCLALYCIQLLCECCEPGVRETYEALGEAAYGWWGRFTIEMCVILSQLAFCTINAVVVAGNARDVVWTLSDCSPDYHWQVTTILWFLLLFYIPVSLIRHMKHLAPLMLVGNVGTVAGVVLLIVAVIVVGSTQHATSVPLANWGNWPLMIGTSVFMWEASDSLSHWSANPLHRVLRFVQRGAGRKPESCNSLKPSGWRVGIDGAVCVCTGSDGDVPTSSFPCCDNLGGTTICSHENIARVLISAFQWRTALRSGGSNGGRRDGRAATVGQLCGARWKSVWSSSRFPFSRAPPRETHKRKVSP